MKKIASLVFIVFLISCGQENQNEKVHFEVIEITHHNGWTGGLTVQIDSLGVITKCKYERIQQKDSTICCIDTLSFDIFDTINRKVDKLKNELIDSIYDGGCQDCGAFFIKISYDKKIIQSMIIGSHRFNNDISNFARYITGLMIDKNQIDSIPTFETAKCFKPIQINIKREFTPSDTY